MSDLRVALVAEGPTDRIVIESVLRATLGERPFVLTLQQPEESLAFGGGGFGRLGAGWAGVYRWCKQVASRSKRLGGDELFETFDLLVVHRRRRRRRDL
jgi:hypothetical protein